MAKYQYDMTKVPDQIVDAATTTANDAATRASVLKKEDDTEQATFGCDYGQVFSPILIKKAFKDATDDYPSLKEVTINTSENLGSFASRTKSAGGIGDRGGVVPYSEDLDPYFYTGANKESSDDTPIIAGKTDANTVHSLAGGVLNDLSIRKNTVKEIDEVRTVGLRGPILLSSWGYDIGGKPVPSRETKGDDTFQFHEDFGGERSEWKTGPVHLLWDEARQVWAGGLPMLMGVATSDIEAPEAPTQPKEFTMEVLRKRDGSSETQTNGNGNGATPATTGTSDESPFQTLPGKPEEVILSNFDPSLSQKMVTKDRTGEHDWEKNPSLVWVLAIKMNYTWIPFYVGCPPECTEASHCANLYKDDPAYKDREGAGDAVNWECEDGECMFVSPGGSTEVGPGGGVTPTGGEGSTCTDDDGCGPGYICENGVCVFASQFFGE